MEGVKVNNSYSQELRILSQDLESIQQDDENISNVTNHSRSSSQLIDEETPQIVVDIFKCFFLFILYNSVLLYLSACMVNHPRRV